MSSAFLKKSLLNFKAYTPGKQPDYKGGSRSNNKLVKLNTNENPFSAPKSSNIVLQEFLKSNTLRLYPDPNQTLLREAASKWMNSLKAQAFYQMQTQGKHKKANFNDLNFVFSNGSDELISAIFRTFLNEGEKVAIPKPGYGAYEVYANCYAAKTLFFNASEDFNFSLSSRANSKIIKQAKIVFFTNPAAPSGIFTKPDEIARCIKKHSDILFVVDEAYIDFTSEGSMAAYATLQNLIILRSFSKAPSLAGIRLGWAIAHPELIAELRMMLDPYNVNALSQAIGVDILKKYAKVLTASHRITMLGKTLKKQLEKLNFFVVPSKANFLLAKFPEEPLPLSFPTTFHHEDKQVKKNSASLHQYLLSNNIFVRYFHALPNYLRITIGSKEENAILIKAVHAFFTM